ncbi:filamentous hemagglutinin N-terminal domain-containing protein [Tolypothrix campylonemoides VB511288]|nr:filamentous hemagglutinin N-terminal domain-containing protein [Tolypothrix campylonemoides VB511288]
MLQSYKNWCWQLELANFLIISGAIVAISGGDYALAQNNIVPDSTLGTESSTVAPLAPGSPIDEIRGGVIRGTNLFHSFSEFNVGEGQGAYFFSPNANIQNIITRVTGSNRSEILGTIGTSGNSNPNLFLINPRGIIFGKNASLNVGGSFVATTANAIAFANQGFFSATNPNTPPLLTVNPSALLFNQIAAAPIQNNSAAPAGLYPTGFDSFGLRVPNGHSLLLVGGNIDMDGGRLNSFGGRVELGGLAGAGTVGLNVDGKELSLSFPDAVQRANISLSNDSKVDVRASNGGSIAINARNLDISGGSNVFAGIGEGLGTVSSQAGDITLNATEAIRIRQSSIIANDVDPSATGNSGDLIITTGSLFVTDSSLLSVSTSGQGNAGSVLIDARDTVSFDGSTAFSTVESGAVGNGGGIDIKAFTLALKNGAALVASTSGQGDAGIITINTRDIVSFDGVGSNESSSGVFSTVNSGAVGNGGDIDIKAGSLFLRDGAQLQTIVREASDTLPGGQGNAGNINIAVRNTVSFDGFGSSGYQSNAFSSVESGGVGNGGDINITAEFLSVSNYAGLIARMLGQGDGGSINIKAEQLSLSSNALLEGDLDKTGIGRGANINLDVKGTILLIGGETAPTGESTRITLGVLPGGIGSGGDLNIKAGSLVLKDGAIIKTSTQGQGNAGNIQINTDVVDISGSVPSSGLPSGLFTSTDTTFEAGDINVDTRTFRVVDGAALSARSRGDGQGGDIRVNATSTFEAVNGGQLVTTTFGKGEAGNIFVNAKDRVTISGSDPNYSNRIAKFPNPIDSQVANAITETGAISGLFANTETNSTGQGGSIGIITDQLIIRDGAQVTVSSANSGTAGSLIVEADSIRLDDKAKISADTRGGGGNINLRSSLLGLRRGSSITTNAQGSNIPGGNITIDAKNGFVVAVPKENSDIRADSTEFFGGNVTINAFGIFGIQFRDVESDKTSDITATGVSREFSGTVELNTPDIDLNSALINLPSVPVDTQVAQGCNSPNYAQSSFIITGRGGLPPNPKDILTPDAVEVDWVTLNPNIDNRKSPSVSTPTKPTPEPIVEATGWVFNAKGQVVFTASAPTSPRSSWNKSLECRS